MNDVLVRALSLAATYLCASALTLNRILFSFTKGNYWKFQGVFYCILFGLSFVVSPASRQGTNVVRPLLAGSAAGYLAGLFAFFFMPLFRGDAESTFRTKDLGGMFFISPLITLSWVVGLLLGVILIFGRKFITSR
jgi:hypothetical protein